jgi:hypothetical protein
VTVTTLRPSADAASAAIVPTGGVSATVVTDDSPVDDATYVRGAAFGSYARLDLTTLSLGAARPKSVTIRARSSASSGLSGAQRAQYKLVDPNNLTLSPAGQFELNLTDTAPATRTGSVATAGPGGQAWDQALIDRMQLQVTWWPDGSGLYQRTHELYVDVDANSRPVAGTPTVTGMTSSTRPAWSGGYSDAEDDPHIRTQVRVWTQAQTLAGGFSPDTTPPVWDSGVLLGAVTGGLIGTDLANVTAYVLYWRVAQAWSDESGVWWSAWSPSAPFTTAVNPPAVPVVTVTPQPTLPGYRVLLEAIAAVNLATENQASLETDTSGWAAGANTTIARSTAWSAIGAASLQLTATGAGDMSAEWSLRPTVRKSVQYTAMATFRSAATARAAFVYIRWYDLAGAFISQSGATLADSAGADVTITVTATSPAAAATAAVAVYIVAAGAGEVHRVDKDGLQAGTSTAWSPGGSASSLALSVEKAEQVAYQGRGPASNWAHAQIASAGGVTRGADGFYPNTADAVTSEVLDRAFPGGPGGSGARMIHWHTLVGASGALDIGLNRAITDDPTPPYLLPAVPGKVMVFSSWAWAAAAFSTKLSLIWVDATNTPVGSATVGSGFSLTTTPVRYHLSGTAPAGACFVRPSFENTAAAAGQDVYLVGVQWEPGVEPEEVSPGQGWAWVWEEVRTDAENLTPNITGQTARLYDHEATPGRPVMYRVRSVAAQGSAQVASAWSNPIPVYMDPPTAPVLKDPFQPENACVVRETGHPRQRREDATEFHLSGRDGDPVVLRDWIGGRDGKLTLFAGSHLELYRLQQLLPSWRALLLQHPEGGQTYARFTDYGEDPKLMAAGYFEVDCSYVETRRPA